ERLRARLSGLLPYRTAAALLGQMFPVDADQDPETGPSQSWGSGGHRHWRVWVVGRQEFLPETGAERAVVEGAADLEQPIGPAPGPAHLLRLGHAAVHQEVGRALGQRRADPLPGPVPFGVIDQMSALAGQAAVQRVQGGPQLPRGR